MLLNRQNLWIEAELSRLSGLIATIDDHLLDICNRSLEAEDADSFGFFDSAEHAIGLGFVACQTYMAAIYGTLHIEKHRALKFGTKHHCGLTKVQIINHAANYWKHNNEWALDRTAARQESIARTFESIGFPVDIDYPLSGILTELATPCSTSLRSVIVILQAWRAELHQDA